VVKRKEVIFLQFCADVFYERSHGEFIYFDYKQYQSEYTSISRAFTGVVKVESNWIHYSRPAIFSSVIMALSLNYTRGKDFPIL